MEELTKLQKLAAARSKLKSHQQRKLQKNEHNVDNMDIQRVENVHLDEAVPPQVPQIQSYFNTSPSHFDMESADNFPVPRSLPVFQEPDSISFEDPEINPNEVLEHISKRTNTHISTSEQLQQMSEQISHIVSDTNGIGHYSNYSDLEKRNLELASQLESERVSNQQLGAEMEVHKDRISQLERQLELIKVDCDNCVRQQVGAFENELKNQRQAFGILVGEQTELSASLSHVQMLLKQKTSECDELQARLKTSRSRVADLERVVIGLREEHGVVANVQSGHNQEHEKIQSELQKLKIHQGEVEQDLSEIQERLRKTQEENSQLMAKCGDYESKLSLADIRIQQLTNGIDLSANEHFMQEKVAMEKQILDLNTSVKNTIQERDQASIQYQQFVQQLNGNVSNLAERLEASTSQNESLMKREQELVQHISELEKHLQNVQNETSGIFKSQPPLNEASSSNRKELESAIAAFDELQKSYAELKTNFDAIKNERDDFVKDVEEKKFTIEELESMIERLKGNQSNNSQLLAEIESEKVAASRAVEQNLKLKQQLEEMQDAFVRMTNDKAELINQLSSEQFQRRELDEHRKQTSQQLQMLTDAIEIKDRELTEMRASAESMSRQTLQHDQLADRLRHYEAHENNVHILGRELQTSRDEVQRLQLHNQQLLEKCAEISTMNETVEDASSHQPIPAKTDSSEPKDTDIHDITQDLSSREVAMRQLESKFMRTIQEVANLQDEKQMLEHIVLQLQGETDTIGEYIALYQHQRSVLKQRSTEKETQLKQLSNDREHMKAQLHHLNELIKRLLIENKVPDGVLQEQAEINRNAQALCEEHAELHIEDAVEAASKKSAADTTAHKIMTLLGEINSSNLVQPSDDSFRPCPLCSGQLMTV